MRNSRGFTLVEVLLAMVITTAVIGIASYAYSMFSTKWKSDLGNFDEISVTARALWQTQGALAAGVPFIVWDQKQKEYVFYFLGRRDGMTMVTEGAIFNPDGSSVIRVFSERTSGGNYQLVYEEAPLSEQALTELNQELNFKFRLVLLKDQTRIKFEYYGFEDYSAQQGDSVVEGNASWHEEYDGAERKLHPEKVRIWFGNDYLIQDLATGHPSLMDLFIRD